MNTITLDCESLQAMHVASCVAAIASDWRFWAEKEEMYCKQLDYTKEKLAKLYEVGII